jgi:uncharacterized membrane protein
MHIAQPGRVTQALSGPFPFGGGRGGFDTGVSVLAIVLRFTLWVLVLLAVVWFAREVLLALQARSHRHAPPSSPAVAELEMRYARGEINRADYLGRRADLGAPPPAALPG